MFQVFSDLSQSKTLWLVLAWLAGVAHQFYAGQITTQYAATGAFLGLAILFVRHAQEKAKLEAIDTIHERADETRPSFGQYIAQVLPSLATLYMQILQGGRPRYDLMGLMPGTIGPTAYVPPSPATRAYPAPNFDSCCPVSFTPDDLVKILDRLEQAVAQGDESGFDEEDAKELRKIAEKVLEEIGLVLPKKPEPAVANSVAESVARNASANS
jgi:hypothetical protein